MGRGSAVTASPWLDPHHQSPVHTSGKRSFPRFPETKTEAYGGDPPEGTKSSNKGRKGEPSTPDPRAHRFIPMPSESHERAPPGKGTRGWIAAREEPRTRPSQAPPECHAALGSSSTLP